MGVPIGNSNDFKLFIFNVIPSPSLLMLVDKMTSYFTISCVRFRMAEVICHSHFKVGLCPTPCNLHRLQVN